MTCKTLILGFFVLALNSGITLSAQAISGVSLDIPLTGILDIVKSSEGTSTYQVFETEDQRLLLQGADKIFDFASRGLYRYESVVPFDPPGKEIGFYNLQEATTEQFPVNIPDLSNFYAIEPIGWNATGTEILYRIYDSESRELFIYRFEFAPETWTQLASFLIARPLDTLEFPDAEADYRLYDVTIKRNPVYDNWLLLNLSLELEDEQTGGIEGDNLYYLWNYQTNERIFFNDLFLGIQSADGGFGWSDDGTLISYPTKSTSHRGDAINILRFDPQNKRVALWKMADLGHRNWTSFLGVNDLIITLNSDYQTDSGQSAYTVSQFIDGTWYDRPLFRLDRPFGEFKFTLTADEAERHELSCLFDLALPSYLHTNDTGEVLNAIPLYTEPNEASTLLSQLAGHDQVTVLGERACTDNTRWQKVMLNDGTTGWITEANRDRYDLQPLGGIPTPASGE